VNLVLVGVRGAGKSAVGKRLARRLGVDFVDLDTLIETREGRSIADILPREGEAAFRKMETEAIAGVSGRDGLVLATGGGVVLREENRHTLRRLGKLVWMRVTPEEARQRLEGPGDRPPLTNLSPLEEARHILQQRAGLYEELADGVVETDGRTPEEVCDELEQLWHDLQGDHLR
jgi:shikimate kinase